MTTKAELEVLYRRRYHAFVRVAAAIAGDEARGADAVHDAYANAIASCGSYRGEASLEAWVWRIVLRAASAAPPRELAFPPPSSNGHEAEVDEGGPIRALVAALPERQRHAVFLRYFADLDYRGI